MWPLPLDPIPGKVARPALVAPTLPYNDGMNRAVRRARRSLGDTAPKRLGSDAKRKRQAQKAARKKQRR